MANKKESYLNYNGTQWLWDRIRKRYDRKLDSVTWGDPSIIVTDKRKISVRISEAVGNALQLNTTPGQQGLYVSNVAEAVKHKLKFGADQVYEYDGSKDVTVPVYSGEYDK